MKLGKLPVKEDRRNLQLADYLTAELAPPPLSCNWLGGNTVWPMFMNDQIGDCIYAAHGHQIQSWTGVSRKSPVLVTDAAILKAYRDVTHYNPLYPSTDAGGYMLDGMKYWRKTGIGGHKVQAFVQLRTGSVRDLRTAVSLFGGVQVGLNLPISARYQIEVGQVWYVSPSAPLAEPGSWGGHAVPVLCYSPQAVWCVTWGRLHQMTWSFFGRYCDEAYAAISEPDWLTAGKSPGGFDYARLAHDLNVLAA